MWRSRARALLLRSSIIRSLPPPPPPRPPRTITRVPPPRPLPCFLSSSRDPILNSSISAAAADPLPEAPSPTEAAPDDIFASHGGADAVADDEHVASVCSVLEATPEGKIAATLAATGVGFNEPLLGAVLLAAEQCSCKKLVSLFSYAGKKNPAAKSLSNLEILVRTVAASDEIGKMEADILWNWVKKFGSVPGSVTTPLLNKIIIIFWKARKSKAAVEVFGNFNKFGCTPDSVSYYLVIRMAERNNYRSLSRSAYEACEKMISSGCFPNGDGVGRILISLCKWKKVNGKVKIHLSKLKAAHSLYLAAKQRKIQIPEPALRYLFRALAMNSETFDIAVKLLEEYQWESLNNAGNIFTTVIDCLCKKKKPEDAKRLLMRMVNVGLSPGKALFNSVITSLSEMGNMKDAKGLMRVMESQGVSPDIYTYSVLTSGYTKKGMTAEAHALLHEAQKFITLAACKPKTDK